MVSILNWIEMKARRIDVRYRLIIMFTLILAGVTGLMGIYATSVVAYRMETTANQKLLSDLKLGEQVLNMYYPGSWKMEKGRLYKGDALVEGDFTMVDRIGNLTGDTVTIFRGDTRVSTNITHQGQRTVNTQVSEQIKKAVLERGETYLGQADVTGVTHYAAYQPIKENNGRIIGIWYVGVPATTYDEIVSSFRLNMIGYSAIGIALGFFAAFIVAYTVYTPLRRIQKGVERIGDGDLTHKIEARAQDEIGRLAFRVNAMMERIAVLIGKTKALTVTVGESSQELSRSSEMSAGLMEGMTVEANEMSRNATCQAELTSQSRMAISEMSSAIQQVAENAQEVSSSIATATTQAEAGERQAKLAIQQIGTIRDTVNSTADIIGGLGVKSQEIDQIVDLITNIASQTNLLALNAAIEAARAGEQGRGFAVVAEEVRKLAEESGEAANRIADLIKEIQTEAHRAVDAMESGTREVATGTEVVADAGRAFQQIIAAVNIVNRQIQEMSAASEEMAASAETAIQAIEATNEAAVGNAEAARKISDMAEEQMAGVEEVNASIEHLNEVIQDLEKSIAFFKIEPLA